MAVKKQEDCCVTIPLLLGSRSDVGTKANIGTASFISTCFNGLNALSGFRNWNTLNSIRIGDILFVIASTTFYTGLLIQRCMYADPTIRSYPDIGDHAFGKTGRTIVSITMNIELYLVAT
ncbi:hypothetical protein Tco_1477554, partial [Tanacetum coccineum]